MYIDSLKVEVIPANDFPDEYYAIWRQIQSSNSDLSSPYFCPEFTAIVASVRRDIYVGVISDGNRIVGFFPFHRISNKHARPIAGPLTDYQGLIIDQSADFSPKELLQQCGLSNWEFDHLIASQTMFSPYHIVRTGSPIINLSEGFESYYKEQREASSQVKKLERKRRKLIQEVGELHFKTHVNDVQILQTLWEWKSQQYLRTGLVDVFSFAWTKKLLERIHATQSGSFSGLLSALYAGDELVAIHMGMQSHSVWHYWFPSYDRRFSKYSPGLLLLLEVAKDASKREIQVLDLGKGNDEYKPCFSNAIVPLAEGCVSLSPFRGRVSQISRNIESMMSNFVRQTPVATLARNSYRFIRHYRAKKRF